jgi:hypothetical protein
MKSHAHSLLAKRRAALPEPIDQTTFLSKFSEKDRQTVIRQLAVYEEKSGPDAAQRFCRLARTLMTLAPHAVKLLAQQAIQFFIPDGKYRKQVFALHVLEDGVLAVYAENVLADAIRAGILATPRQADGASVYRIKPSGDTLTITTLDGQTPDPAPVCKSMTGWNRKAICITLPPDASSAQIQAAESLCALAALEWAAIPQAV